MGGRFRNCGPPLPASASHKRETSRRLWSAVPAILQGSTAPWLEQAGYRRLDIPEMRIACNGTFVLDGEIYPGGDLTVRQGPELEFLLP